MSAQTKSMRTQPMPASRMRSKPSASSAPAGAWALIPYGEASSARSGTAAQSARSAVMRKRRGTVLKDTSRVQSLR